MEAIAIRPALVPARARPAAWGAQFEHFDDGDLFAADLQRLDAQVHIGRLAGLRFAQVVCRAHPLDRLSAPGSTETSHGYTLITQLEGRGTVSQYGQQSELEPGDVALFDNGAPFRHRIAEGATVLMMRLPTKALRSHLPSPEQFCGRRLAAAAGMTAVTVSLARNLCSQAQGALPAPLQECLARQLLETVALSFTHAFGQLISASSVVGGRYARARLFIEQNLGDPELGPHSVARALNVSARYLRMIFAREGECISSYVLRRRLEETARQLVDPRWRGRSICEIAFAWGFNSAPHFSRSFREHYGMPPREYRSRSGAPQGYVPDPLAAIA